MKANLLLTIILSITGDPGTHVQGGCTVDPTLEKVEIDTLVPYQRTFQATGLNCAFEADGRAIIEVKKDGSTSRSATDGGRVNIRVR